MVKVDVAVSKEILEWVISQIRMEDVSSGVTQRLLQWYNGEKTPTFNQVEETSRATGIPLGYFFLTTPPKEDLSLLDYRTIDSLELQKPSRNLIDTIHHMEQIQDWAKEELTSAGATALDFVGSLSDGNQVDSFVSKTRELLNLSLDWFNQSKSPEDSFRRIRTNISNAGVIVMMSGIVGNNTHRPLVIDEFRAFAIVDNYAPLIFINSNDSTNGRLFSLLHEFVHILMGKNNFYNDRYSAHGRVNPAETICNAVAAEVLVPDTLFINKWHEDIRQNDAESTITNLSKFFKCGMTVIARKALDHQFITNQLYNKIAQIAVQRYNEYRKKAKEHPGGDFYKTTVSRIDQRFFRMLVGSVAEGRTLYSDAFRLTNTNRSTFHELREQAGGGY